MIGAVDIGGTKIAVGQVDGNGRLLSRLESSTDADRGYEDALRRIEEMLRETAKGTGGEMTGVGIGCTGPVYPLSGEIGSVEFLPGWEGKNLVADLKRIFDTSVAMENDADAVALGEALCGAGKGRKSLIFVTVGTGIGGGSSQRPALSRGRLLASGNRAPHNRRLWAALLLRCTRLLGSAGERAGHGRVVHGARA
jgi:glucokinase